MLCLCGVYVTDSFCGVSVCLVKLRRLTVWWRPSPPATATATSMSSSQLVGFNMHSIFILPVWDCVWESGGFFFLNYHTIFVFLIFTSSFLLFFVLSPCHWFCISLFSTKNAYVKHWFRLPLILCVRVHLPLNPRHVLHPVFCHHHVEHEPSQPQREGQNHSGAFHLHEQRHQQWRGPTQWSAVGENLSKTQSQRPRRRQEAIT